MTAACGCEESVALKAELQNYRSDVPRRLADQMKTIAVLRRQVDDCHAYAISQENAKLRELCRDYLKWITFEPREFEDRNRALGVKEGCGND